MNKSAIILGAEYAFREKPQLRGKIQRLRILQHIRRNKWKAEWIDPNPGLTDYVESSQIVVPWKERKAFLNDEERADELARHNKAIGYENKSPIVNAVQQVLESTSEDFDFTRGMLSISPERLDRIMARASVNENSNPIHAYQDKFGIIHWPFDAALNLAQQFCASEPSTVLVGVEATEREWSARATRPGEDYLVSLLNEFRASWALIRQWTGHDPAVAAREAQIKKLERFVWDAVYALQKAGLDKEADRLRRALEKS